MTDNSRIDELEARFKVLEAQIRADLEALAEMMAGKESVLPTEQAHIPGQ